MDKQERSLAVKAVTDVEWTRRPGGKLEKSGKGDLKLVVAKAPEYITDADGQVVGVDAWVQLFDGTGRELPIDPHRRIINPPTVPRSGIVETQDPTKPGEVIRVLTPDPLAAFWEAVWGSIEGTPNPKGWRTRGTVTTVFGDTSDGTVTSSNATYLTARSGSGLVAATTGTTAQPLGSQVLVAGSYSIAEGFLAFDTSAISDTDVVSSVVLDLFLGLDDSGVDYTVEVRDSDWGATLTTADWVAGASLGGLTLVASIASSGIGAAAAYKTFTSQTAFLSVNNLKTGVTRLLLNSDRHRTSNAPAAAPGGNEQLAWSLSDSVGTTQDPKLTITHAAPPASSSFFTSQPNRIWTVF